MSTERTPTASPAAPGVAFQVERFDWTSPERLELVGRWFGLRGQRFLRPTLDVQVDGERRRMLADLEHKPWAPEDGRDWVAAFTWRGEPGNFDDAELTVSPELAVQLPPPGGSAEHGELPPATAGADRRPARRPRSAVLEAELAAALAETARLGEELERARSVHSEAGRELRERLRGEHAKIRALEGELAEARALIEAAQTAATEDADRLRDSLAAAAAERDAANVARDEALDAATKARTERDETVERLRAAEAERDALTEARDRARHERNAWMSRARAATSARPSAEARPMPTPLVPRDPAPAESAPRTEPEAPEPQAAPAAPASERRTIQIGERPGPLARRPPVSPVEDRGPVSSLGAWAPRVAVALALAVLVVLVLLLLGVL